jgi:predicted DCC family thiol-disulfide oxidoreductase YuxK
MLTIKANQDYLLFDGDCGICTWSSEIAKRMDGGRHFIVEPYQMFDEGELMRLGIGYDQCTKKLQVITHKGKVHQGALGVNYFLWKQFPWTLLVILIYALPVLLLLELIGYRLIADNRHRISAWFGMTACKLRQ